MLGSEAAAAGPRPISGASSLRGLDVRLFESGELGWVPEQGCTSTACFREKNTRVPAPPERLPVILSRPKRASSAGRPSTTGSCQLTAYTWRSASQQEEITAWKHTDQDGREIQQPIRDCAADGRVENIHPTRSILIGILPTWHGCP